MLLTNYEIYDLAIRSQVFYEDKVSQFPAKVGFYLFKNLKTLKELALEIEEMRRGIINTFQPELLEDGTYRIAPELKEKLQKQLDSLSSLPQDIPLYKLKLEDFEGVKLSGEQLNVLVDMIEEKEEEN